MKTKLLLLLASLSLFSGCATTGGNPSAIQVDPAKIDRARQIAKDAIPYIRIMAMSATQLGTKYANKDEAKSDELKAQIRAVAVALDALIANQQFDPYSVTQALKVKEDYINTALSAVAQVYSANYDKLNENEDASLALGILKAIVDGVKLGAGA